MLAGMPEPADALRAADKLLRDLRGAIAAGAGQADVGRHVAEVVETVVDRQRALEQEVRGRVLAPVTLALDVVEQSAAAMRAQAKALEAASVAFRQASEMLDLQAAVLERTAESLRDPVGTVRAAGAGALRRDAG